MSTRPQSLEDDPRIQYTAQAGVANITFDRPEKRNALTFSMQQAFSRALERAAADDAVHAVVLRGNGSAFCAGVDLQEMAEEHGEVDFEADAARIANQLTSIAGEDTRVRGPAPCPIARIADSFRFQVEVVAPSASRLQAVLSEARERLLLEPAARIAVDVDPQSLL